MEPTTWVGWQQLWAGIDIAIDVGERIVEGITHSTTIELSEMVLFRKEYLEEVKFRTWFDVMRGFC